MPYKDPADQRRWRQEHREQQAAAKRRWYEEHPNYRKEYYHAHKDVYRQSIRKRTYGLTKEQYSQMYEQQGGVCAICREPMDPVCVDHDHTSGVIRGLLCTHCNRGLGAFFDDPELLEWAIDYLKKGGT